MARGPRPVLATKTTRCCVTRWLQDAMNSNRQGFANISRVCAEHPSRNRRYRMHTAAGTHRSKLCSRGADTALKPLRPFRSPLPADGASDLQCRR